jgi:hypothetical protein
VDSVSDDPRYAGKATLARFVRYVRIGAQAAAIHRRFPGDDHEEFR